MMNLANTTLFAKSLLVAHSVIASSEQGDQLGLFKVGGEAAELAGIMINSEHIRTIIGVYNEDGSESKGGIIMSNNAWDENNSEPMAFVDDYSSDAMELIPYNQPTEQRIANGGSMPRDNV